MSDDYQNLFDCVQCNNFSLSSFAIKCNSTEEMYLAFMYFKWRGAKLTGDWKYCCATYDQYPYVYKCGDSNTVDAFPGVYSLAEIFSAKDIFDHF